MIDGAWSPGYADESMILIGQVDGPEAFPDVITAVILSGVAVPEDDVIAIVQGDAVVPPNYVLIRNRTHYSWGAAGAIEYVTIAVQAVVAEKVIEAGLDLLLDKYRNWHGAVEVELTAEGAKSTARQVLLHHYRDVSSADLRLVGEVREREGIYEFEFDGRGTTDRFVIAVEARRNLASVVRIGRRARA